jgi:twitching motility protein PilJ
VKNSEGETVGFRGILRDVTEREVAEAAFEKSLAEFMTIASMVSDGDLTRRVEEGDDTLGEVIGAVNRMLDNFAGMVTQVKQIGLSVSSSATEILAASEQIAAGSQRQADEITNTSSAVEEMAASMTQVSRNAEASAEAARRALEMAENGDRSVRFTAEAMGRIDSAVQQTSDKMRTLGTRSTEISEIINLIDEIAAQTNLLSLNAAIEAAHAGQAGLGFSVVAEEIRKLAERSARATRDVGSLIKTVQGEIAEAVSAMEYGFTEVQKGSSVASEASGALRDISVAVRQSAELIEEISAASEEQARITRNLAEAMQTISSITLETSAGAHETAQTLQGMVELSEHLNKAISQFKVTQDYVHPFSYDGPPPPSGQGIGAARD